MNIVSPSPHIHGGESTRRIMQDVVIALSPMFVFSFVLFGFHALLVSSVAVVSCIFFEWFIERFLLGRQTSLNDWSAAVTGLLLAFNLPSTLPIPLVILGSAVAIGIGKSSFGGLGRNLFNPALVGRVFLLISFPVQMTQFPAAVGVDSVSGATPLAYVKQALASGKSVSQIMPNIDMSNVIFGLKEGSLGEIGGLLLIFGGLYLLYRRVITWHIPFFVLGTMLVFSGGLWAVDPERFVNPLFHIFTGGAVLGAVFMATDYVTSPMTTRGMAIYGVGIGFITIMIRVWGAYPEGISFAILIMNAFVPLINKYVKPSRFGRAIKGA